MKRNVIKLFVFISGKGQCGSTEYNSRIMHVHDIIEIANFVGKEVRPA